STRIRTGLAAASFVLAMGIAGPALADESSIFGTVIAQPSGTPVSGARVDAVGVVDFRGRPVFDITPDSIFFYFLFPVPIGDQVLRVSGNCLETTDVPVTVPPDGLDQALPVVNRSLQGVGDCLPIAHTPLFFDTFWEVVLNHRATLAD